MSFRSLASLRCAIPLFAFFVLSACTDDRVAELSQVDVIDVPSVEVGPNPNINNPTLVIPDTFPVSEGDELTLVWNEEFEGPEIDPETWFFASGDGLEKGIPGGWGNNELQYYLPDNAQIVNGVLELTARRENVRGLNYSSARINTEDRFAFKYGRIEASIKMPAGQGFLPAFWMLSQDSSYNCGVDDQGEDIPCVWAATGEIDIVEAANLGGTGGNEIFGTIHYGTQFSSVFTTEYYTPSVDVTESFNTYALEWDEDEIRWYFNGLLYAVQNSWYSVADNGGDGAPFNQNFHILLNLAVGGNLPGDPNGTTPFPATMQVDWVRVYSGEDPSGGVATEPNASAPTPTEDPAGVTSIYSDAYDDIAGVNFNPNWGQATVFTEAQIAGNKMLKYANLNYQGIDFAGNPQDVSDKGFLHLDVWTADSTALNVYLISPGDPPVETSYELTGDIAPNSWVSVDIPLTEFDGVDLTNLIQLKFDGNGTIFLDNLYFAGEAPVTAPEVAAPTPTADPAVVISLFSDAYTNIADIDYNPNWGQATVVTQENIAGNNTLKYAGLNYQGIDFEGNPQDVSGLLSLHLDFWTADSTALNVYLISPGPVEKSYVLTGDIAPNSWVSVDIPLTEFADVDLTNLIQLKLDGNGTIFLDNLYFEGEAAPTEPAAAPAAPTADAGTVTSVFSNAYTDPAVVNYDPNWGQATDATIESIAGNDVWKLAGLTYQGIDFIDNGNAPAGALDVSGYDTLHIDYWSADATTLNVFLISPGAETPYNIPITTGSWQSVDIPLSAFSGVVDLTNVIQMKFDDAGSGESATFFIDNIYFYTAAAATEPSDAPAAPTASDTISIFSDAYTPVPGVNTNPGWGQATVTTTESIAGNNVLKMAGLTFQGIDWVTDGSAQDVSGKDTVHIDFWTANATAVDFYLIGGGVETAYALPIVTGSWQSVDIPLSAFTGVDLTQVIQFKFDAQTAGDTPTIFIDNLYFYTAAAATEPSAAPAAPTASDTISIFSDAYTDVAGVDTNPNWGQATVTTTEPIAGNDVLKMAGLDYQGIDFGGARDVSGKDTVHIDFWTADATAVDFYLIGGGVETAYALPIVTGSWQSVDIPLSEFAGVDLTQVIQFKFDAQTAGDSPTIFVDNLYFYTAAAATEPSAAPAAPTASDTISIFSDAYTDVAGVDTNPNWGQATVTTTEPIAGNDVLKMAGLDYQGIDWVTDGSAQDVSGKDTVHIDFWTANATAVDFYLIGGGVETAYALPIVTGSWQSVDIPLSAFTGVDLTQVIQFKFDAQTAGDTPTIFVDNLYFYTAGGGSGGELAVNGDFETGDISGWTDFSGANNGTFNATMAEASGGLWSGNLVASVPAGGGPASFPVVKQANVGVGTVQPNTTVTVSFDLKGSIVGTGGVIFVEFFSELSGGGTSQAGIISQPVPTSSWVNYSIPVTTGSDVSGGVTLQLKADCGANAGCTVDAYFDNVSITIN